MSEVNSRSRPAARIWFAGLALGAAGAACGSDPGGECSPACGPCLECYYGTCVPLGTCDAGTDGSGDDGPDSGPDGRPDAQDDASADTHTDLPVEVDAEAEADAESGVSCRPLGGRCPDGQVCDLPGCALLGIEGSCVPRPASCPGTEEPVCGCDNVTYRNNCERLRAAQPVDRVGACRVFPPPVCRQNILGEWGWRAADGTYLCYSDCSSCIAECGHDLGGNDAWYATCSDETHTGCGEHTAPLLIVRGDCS